MTRDLFAVILALGLVGIGALMGYLCGRTRTRIEQRAMTAMWAENRDWS